MKFVYPFPTGRILTSILVAMAASFTASPALAQAADDTPEQAPAAYVNSTPEAYAAMQQLPVDEPIYMLNLIRFRELAEYEEDSEFASKAWTGEQAYAQYSRVSGPIARRVGGTVAFAGMPQLTLIGPDHEQWDAAFIIAYPNVASFLALVSDPEYRTHAFHRSAAIADSRLVRMASFPVPE